MNKWSVDELIDDLTLILIRHRCGQCGITYDNEKEVGIPITIFCMKCNKPTQTIVSFNCMICHKTHYNPVDFILHLKNEIHTKKLQNRFEETAD